MNQERKLYGITALFESANEIIHAAKTVQKEGYKKFDVHTPYPVHGLDGAMGLGRSKLPWVTLIMGFTGAGFGLWLSWWTHSVDYPLNIAGKPLFSWPAYIPIVFECAVLLAATTSVLALIVLFSRLPNIGHALQGTEYLARTSSDHFGIWIGAKDTKFNEHSIHQLLKDLNGKHISLIYENEREPIYKILTQRFALITLGIALVASAGTYIFFNRVLDMVPFNWMSEQDRVDAQSTSTFFSDGMGMRLPVEGTVARGFLPYIYPGDPEGAAGLPNPVLPTNQVLKQGQRQYAIHCQVCHGAAGEGDNFLQGQYPRPPSLHSSKIREWTDGQLFHVITEGQNVMPPYRSKVLEKDRWMIVHYIRALQRSFHAKATDIEVKEVKK